MLAKLQPAKPLCSAVFHPVTPQLYLELTNTCSASSRVFPEMGNVRLHIFSPMCVCQIIDSGSDTVIPIPWAGEEISVIQHVLIMHISTQSVLFC